MVRIFTLIGLMAGCFFILAVGNTPGWLQRIELVTVSLAGLVYGYTTFTPALPWWARFQEVRGMICVYIGVAAMFIPAEFVVSSFFIGIGMRMVLTSNEQLLCGATITKRGDLVIRDEGGIARQ